MENNYENQIRELIDALSPSMRLVAINLLISAIDETPRFLKDTYKGLDIKYSNETDNENFSKMYKKTLQVMLSHAFCKCSPKDINSSKQISIQKHQVLHRIFIQTLSGLKEVNMDIKNNKNTKRWLKINWFYFTTISLISILVGYIVFLGWAQKPIISIEFNVGEIIGGILIGSGAMIAGYAYSSRVQKDNTMTKRNENAKEDSI